MTRPLRSFGFLTFGLLVPFAGCSSDPAASTSEGDITTAMRLTGTPFTVAPGADVTRCTAVRGDNVAAAFTNRFTAKQTGHHVILYTVDHPLEPGSFECPQGGQWNWNDIFGSQKPENEYTLPEGVGYKLEPNQQFVIETHVINAGSTPIEASSEFNLEFVDAAAVKYPAGAVFVGTSNIAVDPRSKGHAQADCTIPADLQINGFFGHTHRHGTELTASFVNEGVAEAPFYAMGDWEDPKILERVELKAGKTVRVGCDYQNASDKKLGYPDEMCHAVGLYWPANGALICMSYGNDPTCKCYQPINKDIGNGGSAIEIEVSRAASVPGAKGNVSEGRPIYCYVYAKKELDEQGPIAAKLAYWAVTAPDATPLASETDKVKLNVRDVTPGEYYATCSMDTIYGGYFPGSGSPIVYPYAPFTVAKNAPAKLQLQLNAAMP